MWEAIETMDDLEAWKRKLLMLREELRQLEGDAKSSAQAVELDQSRVGRLSRMDAMRAQAMSIETNRRREQHILRIDAAVQRIETDDYGYCASCDEAIDPRRLEIDPAATLCIRCASQAKR